MQRNISLKDTSHAKPASTPSEADQRALLEEIVELLPKQKGVTETRFLLRLLRTAMMLQATLDDLLIPNSGYSVETLYDIDCFQRILDHFLLLDQASAAASPCIMEENQFGRRQSVFGFNNKGGKSGGFISF
uniref:BTB/POZ domain-containing protein At5g03250-like n=1 Tax=Nicotiana tabacum TaxID=4097 RepID=A0A1S3X4D1_TOBAC|nr:PREDICTED: BTB/POZ domain-containing protein At5g03250-like [Nicotiana tabacum]